MIIYVHADGRNKLIYESTEFNIISNICPYKLLKILFWNSKKWILNLAVNIHRLGYIVNHWPHTETNVNAIIAASGNSFLPCSWTARTLHDHAQDLNGQSCMLAGARSPRQEFQLHACAGLEEVLSGEQSEGRRHVHFQCCRNHTVACCYHTLQGKDKSVQLCELITEALVPLSY